MFRFRGKNGNPYRTYSFLPLPLSCLHYVCQLFLIKGKIQSQFSDLAQSETDGLGQFRIGGEDEFVGSDAV